MSAVAVHAWFSIVALCLVMYVILDGYDLGIGMLLLTERDVRLRRDMVEIVATAWDGNESWLILLGVGLWAGLPTAYGAMLPGLYVPLIVMLFALIFRGVAIEMVSSSPGVPRGWGYAFGIGSLVAAFAQGTAFGGVLSGIQVRDDRFVGGSLDFLTPYSVLTGLTTVLLYALAGAGFLLFKGEGKLRDRAGRSGRRLLGLTAVFAAVCALSLGATAGPIRLGVPARAVFFGLAVAVAAAGFVLAWRGFGGGPDRRPFTGIVIAEVAGLVAVAVAVYPTVVPPALTVEQAAAPAGTLTFVLVGIGLNIPLVLFYNWYAHHVFRGKYRAAVEQRPTGTSAAGTALGRADTEADR